MGEGERRLGWDGEGFGFCNRNEIPIFCIYSIVRGWMELRVRCPRKTWHTKHIKQ